MTSDEMLETAISCAHANCDDLDAPPMCDLHGMPCRYATGGTCGEWESDLGYLLSTSYEDAMT